MILGRINETQCKLFLDTGSEVNVIDENFLINKLEISKKRVVAPSKIIKCANGSKLDTIGSVFLDVSVGVNQKSVEFIVASQSQPNIILGIRSMKSLQCNIDLRRNNVSVQGVDIPFINKIKSDSESSSKNCGALQRGIVLQQKHKW